MNLPAAAIARFWARVPIGDPGQCWEWTGNRDRTGYGRIGIANKIYLAHRISYILNSEDLLDSDCVLHRCDNPPCVNPGHLFKGDRGDNARDMAAKGRQFLQVNPHANRGDRHWTHRRPDLRRIGSASHRSVLNEGQVLEIRNRVAAGEKKKHVARSFGISQYALGAVAAGITWKHVGGPITPFKAQRNPRRRNHVSS